MRDGWKRLSIKEISTVFTDGDWIETKNQATKGIRLIQTGNVGIGVFKNRKDKARFISNEVFDKLKCQEVFQGDCLVSRLPDPVGRSCVVPATEERMITAVDCTILRFDKSLISSRFFKYYSQSLFYLSDVEDHCTGATRKRISRKNLGKITVPLPPLPEQKRIVAILDEAFAGIEKAMANTEKNLANAKELFDSYLFSIFTACAKNWKTRELGQVCNIVGGGTPSKNNSAFYDGDIPWATVRDMRKPILSRTEFCITQEAVQSSSTNIIPADNVIIATRVGLGKVCLINQDTAINQDLRGIIPKSKELDVNYLFRWLQSVSRKIEDEGTGATVKGVKLPFIKSLSIPLPPLPEQIIIVEQLNELDHGTQRLQSIYQQKITALAELKQSLLQKAFSGELTADEQLLPAEVAA